MVDKKGYREIASSVICATLSLFLIPLIYLITNPIPSDIYETFRLFDYYNPLSIGAFFWIQVSAAGLVFGLINGSSVYLSEHRPIFAGSLLSIPSVLFLFTLLLGSGQFITRYRWPFIVALVVFAPVFGFGVLKIRRRIPKRAQLVLTSSLVAVVGLASWILATAVGSVATLYPFLFIWLQSVWTFSVYLLWSAIREDLPRVPIIPIMAPLILIGVGIDLSRKLDPYYVRAQNILMWRMPEVAVAYDLRAPLLLVKARSRVLFPQSEKTGAQMVDLKTLKGPVEKPHVLIIVMDAFRYDRLTHETAPHTFAIAESGTSFSRSYSPSPTTLYSLASLMTGLTPSHLLSLESIPLTFPQYLSYFGYRTGVNAPLNWDPTVFPIAASGAGYVWDDISNTRDDSKSLPLAAKRIVDSQIPRFEYVHLMGTHGPFRTSRDYNTAVRAADKKIGSALALLSKSGTLKNTIVVIAGDHGEALGEHGMWAHSQSLYEEQTRIPIVINRSIESQLEFVSLTDVPELISDIIGADFPNFENDSTFSVQEFHIITTLMWRSIRRGKWAYHRRIAQKDELLFDLDKDPLELNNVASIYTNEIEEFRKIEKKIISGNRRSSF